MPKKHQNRGNWGWQGEGKKIEYVEQEKCLNRGSRGWQGEENWTECAEKELELEKCLNRGSRGWQGKENWTEQEKCLNRGSPNPSRLAIKIAGYTWNSNNYAHVHCYNRCPLDQAPPTMPCISLVLE